MWLKFLKFLLVPLVAMLVGYGVAIWQMMGADKDIQPKAHTQHICPTPGQPDKQF